MSIVTGVHWSAIPLPVAAGIPTLPVRWKFYWTAVYRQSLRQWSHWIIRRAEKLLTWLKSSSLPAHMLECYCLEQLQQSLPTVPSFCHTSVVIIKWHTADQIDDWISLHHKLLGIYALACPEGVRGVQLFPIDVWIVCPIKLLLCSLNPTFCIVKRKIVYIINFTIGFSFWVSKLPNPGSVLFQKIRDPSP